MELTLRVRAGTGTYQAELFKINPMENALNIQDDRDLLGLSKSTVPYWRKAFEEFIRPHHTKGGQWRFTSKELTTLKIIPQPKRSNLSLSEINLYLLHRNLPDQGIDASSIDNLTDRIGWTIRHEILGFFDDE